MKQATAKEKAIEIIEQIINDEDGIYIIFDTMVDIAKEKGYENLYETVLDKLEFNKKYKANLV
jgi:endo-beta-N-acetylglucosaminidase D